MFVIHLWIQCNMLEAIVASVILSLWVCLKCKPKNMIRKRFQENDNDGKERMWFGSYSKNPIEQKIEEKEQNKERRKIRRGKEEGTCVAAAPGDAAAVRATSLHPDTVASRFSFPSSLWGSTPLSLSLSLVAAAIGGFPGNCRTKQLPPTSVTSQICTLWDRMLILED